MSSWDQANKGEQCGLAWRNRKKISQIISDYLYLPFFLLIILWPRMPNAENAKSWEYQTTPSCFLQSSFSFLVKKLLDIWRQHFPCFPSFQIHTMQQLRDGHLLLHSTKQSNHGTGVVDRRLQIHNFLWLILQIAILLIFFVVQVRLLQICKIFHHRTAINF